MGLIYCVTNKVNGKKYIGLTSRSLRVRQIQHISDSKKVSSSLFHRALKKYGEENFTWEVLEAGIPKDLLPKKEQEYIEKYNTFTCGYNLTLGGEGVFGYKKSEESKAKIAKALRGKKKTAQHLANNRKYREEHPLSEDTLLRMSLAHKGKKPSEETRRKLSMALAGRQFSEEHRKNLSIKGSQRVYTKEDRVRISQVRKNLDIFKYEYKGQRKTIAQFAEQYGVRANLLYQRTAILGWSLEKAIETPLNSCGRKRKAK